MAGKKSRSLSPKGQEKNARAASSDKKSKRGAPGKTKDQAPAIYKGPSAKVKRNSKERNVLSNLSKEIAAKEGKHASKKEESSEEEEEEERIVDMTENKQEAESDAESGDDNEGSDDDDGEGKPKKGKFFSDDNAGWLKPKQNKSQLLSSDDEDEDGAGDDDEMIGGDDDDSDEEMEVERQSRLLDAEMQVQEEEGEEEFRETVSKHTAIYHLPTLDELEGDHDRVVPPSELKSHIESILGVLAEFKERREEGRARTEYIERLAGFMAELFGYLPELMSYFLTMFSPAEALEFVDYSDKPRPMVVRTNTLKTRRKDLALALMKRGVSLDPLANWSKVGLKIVESPVPVGATPEYLSGHYMLQSAASMCPVLALAPEPKERVLDMSAAPGGKTSYIAQLMRNTGVVFANDLRPDRQKATVANMHRLGVKNVVTCMDDGRKLPQIFKHYKFDRILLDAPCSGLGVISRDPSVKVQRTLADVNKCAHLQKELILAAIDCLNHKSKTGGVMVYSTCSVAVAENEEVVNYALQKRDIKIIDTGLDFGRCNNSDNM
jgi:ribosomal RNA methyltransferase Nop2